MALSRARTRQSANSQRVDDDRVDQMLDGRNVCAASNKQSFVGRFARRSGKEFGGRCFAQTVTFALSVALVGVECRPPTFS
jgi:hypothetical protein